MTKEFRGEYDGYTIPEPLGYETEESRTELEKIRERLANNAAVIRERAIKRSREMGLMRG